MFPRANVCLVVLLLAACRREPVGPAAGGVISEFSGETMGSTYEVKLSGPAPVADCIAATNEELAAFDLAFSSWREDSEIRRVNAHRSTEPIAVSERFASVLATALEVAAATDGAFDPTVKPLSELYRRARRDPDRGLADEELLAARERVSFRLVSLRDGMLSKARPDVEVDLDGLVAGAAADALARRFDALGVRSFYIQITGEVYCRGRKSGGEPWRIGVEDPRSGWDGKEQAVRTVALTDRALCTSGDYRNVTVVAGRVVHHVFDPRTARNPEHAIVSASVLADTCAVADALGTALMVMGDEETRRRWPRLQALGARGALLLRAAAGGFESVEIDWPADVR